MPCRPSPSRPTRSAPGPRISPIPGAGPCRPALPRKEWRAQGPSCGPLGPFAGLRAEACRPGASFVTLQRFRSPASDAPSRSVDDAHHHAEGRRNPRHGAEAAPPERWSPREGHQCMCGQGISQPPRPHPGLIALKGRPEIGRKIVRERLHQDRRGRERQGKPLAGDGVDVSCRVADQHEPLPRPRANALEQRPCSTHLRFGTGLPDPLAQRREPPEQLLEAVLGFAVAQEGHVDAARTHRRHVGLDALRPVHFDEVGPGRQREVPADSVPRRRRGLWELQAGRPPERRVEPVGGDQQARLGRAGIGPQLDTAGQGGRAGHGAMAEVHARGQSAIAQRFPKRRPADPDPGLRPEARFEDGPVLLEVTDAAERGASILGDPDPEPLQLSGPGGHQALPAGFVGYGVAPLEHHRPEAALSGPDGGRQPRGTSSRDRHVVHQLRIRASRERAVSFATWSRVTGSGERSSPASSCRSASLRRSFPLEVRGRVPGARRWTSEGRMPVRSITRPRIHSASAAPSVSTRRTSSSPSAVGTPTAAVQPGRTPSTPSSASSNSWGAWFTPRKMTRSFARPETNSSPPSTKPRSPVSSQPSISASRVAAGFPKYPCITEGPRTKTRPPLTSMSMPGSGAPAEASSRPPATQVRGPRPVGVNATAREASESPYTGISARPSKPLGANRSEKRRSTAGATGSAPFSAKRQEDRSTPSISGSRTRRTQSPYAKFGATEMVARWREIARSQMAGRARNTSGGISVSGPGR